MIHDVRCRGIIAEADILQLDLSLQLGDCLLCGVNLRDGLKDRLDLGVQGSDPCK